MYPAQIVLKTYITFITITCNLLRPIITVNFTKKNIMPTLHIKWFATVAITTLLFFSCTKPQQETPFDYQAFFTANFFGKNVTITRAVDNNTTDITSQFSSYTLNFGTNRELSISNNLFTVRGTWAPNADYSKLTFTVNGGPIELAFLAREWQLNNTSAPPVQLATNAGGTFRAVEFR
jgi:hypothetical protein